MGRLLDGFGVGVISYTVKHRHLLVLISLLIDQSTIKLTRITYGYDLQVPVYIAEIAPQNMRGSLGSVNQVGF